MNSIYQLESRSWIYNENIKNPKKALINNEGKFTFSTMLKIDSRSEIEDLIPFEKSDAPRLAERIIAYQCIQSFHTVFLIDSQRPWNKSIAFYFHLRLDSD